MSEKHGSFRPSPLQILGEGVEALSQGRYADARRLALQAVSMDPLSEDAWLLLAALAAPRNRSLYLEHLLKIHPESEAARQAMKEQASPKPFSAVSDDADPLPLPEEILAKVVPAPPAAFPSQSGGTIPHPSPQVESKPGRIEADSNPPQPRNGRRKVFGGRGARWAVALLSISCLLALTATAFAGAVAYPPEPPVLARVAKEQSPIPPTFTPSSTSTITPSFTPTFTSTFTPTPTYTPTDTLPPTSTPWPVVEGPPGAGGERWIDVDISAQRVYAYEGDTPIRTFIVSTGVAAHPTVIGRFRIYIKLLYDDMAGPGYYLPDVPYVMYFYEGYSLHGTYWHHNFGTPMSHGCVNMYTPDAEWLFYWASVGTPVITHW
jgi:lipoprotein-anchoring transpeptidase ErfK/SrfK